MPVFFYPRNPKSPEHNRLAPPSPHRDGIFHSEELAVKVLSRQKLMPAEQEARGSIPNYLSEGGGKNLPRGAGELESFLVIVQEDDMRTKLISWVNAAIRKLRYVRSTQRDSPCRTRSPDLLAIVAVFFTPRAAWISWTG
jgi:hypothetical protein